MLPVTVALCVATSLFPFFTVGTRVYNGQSRCLVMHHRHMLYNVFTWITLRCGELLIPSILVGVFTIAITAKLLRGTNRWRSHLSSQQSVIFQRIVQERQLTGILLTIAMAFVLVRLPYTVFYYINNYKKEWWGGRENYPWIAFYIYAAYSISMCLSTVNYVINFFVYYLMGSTFRRELGKLCVCCRDRKRTMQRDKHPAHLNVHYSSMTSTLSQALAVQTIRKPKGACRPVTSTAV